MNPQALHQAALIQYRPGIDGLRAVAVISVIVFHINPSYLAGGFLGVDIFFVISGYLITLLLAKDIANTGRLNLVDFYRRRIQRIFPALLFMLVATLLVGYFMLVPKDYAALSKSALWSLFSAANIYFFSSIDTGYFATGSEELPLLHLWSLGIEEQFYILWPFIVWLLVKWVKSTTSRLVIVSVVLVASLLSAQLFLHSHQSFTYYMLPTRAWELMAGGLVALMVFANIGLNKQCSQVAAGLGAVGIALSLALVSKNDDVPGLAAIPVVLGSALVLMSGDKTFIGRFLSLKPIVAIGLVSYSAYLWHWPILAFLRYALVKVDVPIMAGVMVATFTMASLSYFCVEQPLRKRKTSQKNIFVWYFSVPVVMIATLSVLMIHLISVKNPALYDWKSYRAVNADTRAAFAYDFNCQYDDFSVGALTLAGCVFPEGRRPTVLLVGDSHAAHYLGMLRVFAQRYGFTLRNATQSACPLLLDAGKLNWINKKYTHGCAIYRDAVKSELSKYDTVIMGGTWNTYDQSGKKAFRLKLKDTVSILSGQVKNVIILANIPIISDYNKECQIRSVKMPHLQCEKRHLRHGKTAPINRYLSGLSKTYPNVHYFDIRDQLCKDDTCSPYFNDIPVYFNSTHLTMAGSQGIGEKMLKDNDPGLSIFEKIGRVPQQAN
uniref:acyltransferase family protein n=1 Tax=Crenothrix polyspora TaxID=360316 RepID=UPI0015C63819|nr:acyltransferase family protein [Crenothrix polyspora]